MEKLKSIIDHYGRWQELTVYLERIETHIDVDFSLSLENAKALLETIGKEICCQQGIEIPTITNTNIILKKAFIAIGYSNSAMVSQISQSLSTIGQNFGELRNQIGLTSHGKPLDLIKERNNQIDGLTKDLLIDTTEIVACFLIRTFEAENPRIPQKTEVQKGLEYIENQEFNDSWDEMFGEFNMGEYSFTASEILFNVDNQAYLTEYNNYKADKDE